MTYPTAVAAGSRKAREVYSPTVTMKFFATAFSSLRRGTEARARGRTKLHPQMRRRGYGLDCNLGHRHGSCLALRRQAVRQHSYLRPAAALRICGTAGGP